MIQRLQSDSVLLYCRQQLASQVQSSISSGLTFDALSMLLFRKGGF